MNSQIVTRQISANGLRFVVDEVGEGDAVALCLHGFPESRVSWRHQLPALAAAGWKVVAPDLRGYGDSDRPKERDAYRLRHLVADAAGLFDAYHAQRRLLIAHDWGALIAWSFAMQEARTLAGLVVLNVPHPAVLRKVIRRSWAQRRRSWYVGFFQVPVLPEIAMTAFRAKAVADAFRGMAIDKSAFPDEVVEPYRRNALKPGAMTAMINYYRSNLRELGTETASPRIGIPTLMIWGEEDKALGLELTEGYDELVADFSLQRLPGVSHWVQQEAPQVVNDHLLAWMAIKGLDQSGR